MVFMKRESILSYIPFFLIAFIKNCSCFLEKHSGVIIENYSNKQVSFLTFPVLYNPYNLRLYRKNRFVIHLRKVLKRSCRCLKIMSHDCHNLSQLITITCITKNLCMVVLLMKDG